MPRKEYRPENKNVFELKPETVALKEPREVRGVEVLPYDKIPALLKLHSVAHDTGSGGQYQEFPPENLPV